MQLAPILKKARRLRNFWYVRDYGAASTMTEFGLTRNVCAYDRATGTYWIRELDLRLAPAHHGLLRQLWSAIALKRAGVKFSNCGTDIIADTGTFQVLLETPEELFILSEIIVDGVYNAVSGSRGSVVIDIGMNVGFASLYFAAQPWVEAVWSYEPVPQTYARAVRNFERNPALAAKVRLHNYGLSDAAGTAIFDFCPKWPGATGVHGLSSEFRRMHGIAKSEVGPVTVELRSICDVVREFRTAQPGVATIVKLDCEGAEYGILDALESAGLMRELDAFLIEWHERGPGQLERLLTNAGFFVISLMPNATRGMLYAHKQSVCR